MSNIINTLRAPFPSDRIEWRLAMCGNGARGIWARCLAYIDNRAAMERLDDALGANWSQEERFSTIGSAAVCTVSIHIKGVEGYPDRTVTGSCAVEANGDIDAFKSAASGAMKRAVVNLGVGRYLYNLPEAWAEITEQGAFSGKTKDGTFFKWNPPPLPAWALPEGDTGTALSPAGKLEAEREEVKATQPTKSKEVTLQPKPINSDPLDPSDPWSVVIHFGKNKDKALRDLPENTLKWYAKEWQPKPFKGTISKADTALRDALDIITGAQKDKAPIPLSDDMDQVPF